MNARAKFKKMAADVRLIIPDTDEGFWNFYRNTLSGDEPRLITIPVAFKKDGKDVAQAEFLCLPSPYQLMWLAAERVQAAHPRLQWDGVAINGGRVYTKAEAVEAMAESSLVRHAKIPARSAFDLVHQFNVAMRSIDLERAAPQEIRAAYDDAHARMAAQICAGAYEIEWKKGGPGWLRSMLPGFKRG